MVSLGLRSLALFSLTCPRFTLTFLIKSSNPARPSSTTYFASRRAFGSTVTTFAGLVVASALLRPALATTTSCTARNMATNSDLSTGYLNAKDAAALDAELMSTPGFSLEQLMELAGLAVAEAVYQVVNSTEENKGKILLLCGPGNNGGDGLVAARHLVMFGYECDVFYPKQSKKQHFVNLVQQCEDVGIPVLNDLPADLSTYSAMVDAIFGFSFQGAPREPFATALERMKVTQLEAKVPVISVDVPSGWNVDEGDVAGTNFVPEVLVSLTTPKESAKTFVGRHFVGGRFLPPKLAEKYNVKMPSYPGVSQVMDVTVTQLNEE